MTVPQVVEFLNREQRDPRLNEILYPYADSQKAREIIAQYEPNRAYVQKGQTAARRACSRRGSAGPVWAPEPVKGL